MVGRYPLDLGNAHRAGEHWPKRRVVRYPVLGYGYGWLCPHKGIHRRALRALVPIQRLLSILPLPRANVEAAPALGLEPGQLRTGGIRRSIRGRDSAPTGSTAQHTSRSHLQTIS